jgi:hypothetical protein
MKIFDLDANEQDQNWLIDNYGPVNVRFHSAPEGYDLVELRESEGPAVYVVKVLDVFGAEHRSDRWVARHWPGREFNPELPPLPEGEWFGTGVYGEVNDNGDIGFGAGGGDYYFPDDGGVGASSFWVLEYPSDCVENIGMLGLTEHRSLDMVFQWVTGGVGPEPEPPGCGFDSGAYLDAMESGFAKLRQAMQIVGDAHV